MKNTSSVVIAIVIAAMLSTPLFAQRMAGAAQSISAIITGPLDDQGNVKVHEHGTVVIRDPEASREPWHAFLGPDTEYIVPDGKRLVIEYANGIAQLPGTAQPDWTLSITEATGGQGYHFMGTALVNCTNCYVMSEQVRLYAPPLSRVHIGVVPVGSVLRLSGYLVDVP